MVWLYMVVVGIALTAAGAVVIVVPIAFITRDAIEEISKTRYGINPYLARALLNQRLFAAIGIIIIVIGSSLQSLGAFL